ncbi:hypothetical protein WA026_019747 [Henosepilachna vigintioctopunctata]|uniref:Cell division cycle protein 16 homolog n=1 Tax=Henosepilachna vigintioctopunctata TaxID=420089 RepID=A0AAW1UHU5_9CUCU
MKTTNISSVDIEKYRKLVQHYIDMHMHETALYWADKVVSITENPRDIYWLAQCMYHLKQFHRAVHLLRTKNLEKTFILCNYLTVRCLLAANELNEALNVVNILDVEIFPQQNLPISNNTLSNFDTIIFDDRPKNQVYASIMFLKGRVLEAMDNRILATECYKQALHCDVYCFEAFDALTRNQMLSASEEEELLKSLPVNEHCSTEEADVIKLLYESKLKKYHAPTSISKFTTKTLHADPILLQDGLLLNITPNHISNLTSTPNFISSPSISTPNIPKTIDDNKRKEKNLKTMETDSLDDRNLCLEKLKGNNDILVSQAEAFYYNCDFQKCSNLTDSILKQDPWHTACLPIHISSQVELKETTKLFLLAHNLVDLYPNLAISWYAVGCYYYIIGKSDLARRYLAKATCLDRLFGPAWLAYGHSFAVENEHDQAMAAYFKASQLMKGCHLPLLYIGLECGLTNNIRLADRFFQQAQSIAPDDPFILHEKGVINFQNLEYNTAEKNFKDALEKIRRIHSIPIPQRWVSLLNNLGHTCRKLKKYEEALEYHHQALLLSPQNASIYSAIGFVHSLVGNAEEAVDWFHKALGLERDDTFSSTMLNYVIEQLAEEKPPFPGAPEGIPKYNPKESSKLTLTYSEMNETSVDKGESEMSTSIRDSIKIDASQSNEGMQVNGKTDSSCMSIEVDMIDASKSIQDENSTT